MKYFTIDFDGENFNNRSDAIIKKCIENDEKLFGENFTIYTKKDDIVKRAIEAIGDEILNKIFIDKDGNYKNKAHLCDFIRIFILSESTETVYLDPDMYVYLYDKEAEEKLINTFQEGVVLTNCSGCKMYSGTNGRDNYLKAFEVFKDFYKKSDYIINEIEIMKEIDRLNILKLFDWENHWDCNVLSDEHYQANFFNRDVFILLIGDNDKIIDYLKSSAEKVMKEMEELLNKKIAFAYISEKHQYICSNVLNLEGIFDNFSDFEEYLKNPKGRKKERAIKYKQIY